MSMHTLSRIGRRYGINDYPVSSSVVPWQGFPVTPTTSSLWNNLLAYYRFDNSVDASGNGHDGTDTNMSYRSSSVVSIHGNAAQFVSNTSKITFASPIPSALISGTSSWTIAGWVKSMQGSSGFTIWFQGNNNMQIYSNKNDNTINFAHGAAGNCNTAITIGNWYHFAFNKSGSNYVIWVNGTKPALTGNTTIDPAAAAGTQQMGGQYVAESGSIDEFGIWGRQLSDAEIISLYNKTSGSYY